MPIMYVVAGPAGSGETSAFPGDSFDCDYFNADHYAAMLNGGSYIGIPNLIRKQVGPVCEKFIQDHIAAGIHFATETTLRSTIVFDQMKQAHEAGFSISFTYICVDNIGTSVKRVKQRAFMGGHSASEETVQDIRSKSLFNLRRAFDVLGKSIDLFDIYDNSAVGMAPKLVASFVGRGITFLAAELPAWMDEGLGQTPYATGKLRELFEESRQLPVHD
jgi:predicted ABC-type ATPase